ncbi:MAG: PH domain-containing protein [Candidatus Nomurabacteria bacterium]
MILEQENLLDEGEEIIEKIRKHWVVYVSDFFLHTFGCLFFITIANFLASKGNVNGLFYGDYGAMILVSFVLLFWTSFFFAWTKNYFDVWYVTDQHVIAVNQKDIFDRDEAFMELVRIQDVFFEQNTFLATFLGYGKLRVQSAGTEQEFIIEDVCDVEGCAHRIMELRDKAQGKGQGQPVASSL